MIGPEPPGSMALVTAVFGAPTPTNQFARARPPTYPMRALSGSAQSVLLPTGVRNTTEDRIAKAQRFLSRSPPFRTRFASLPMFTASPAMSVIVGPLIRASIMHNPLAISKVERAEMVMQKLRSRRVKTVLIRPRLDARPRDRPLLPVSVGLQVLVGRPEDGKPGPYLRRILQVRRKLHRPPLLALRLDEPFKKS
jgi:hypothetical protein